MKLILGWTTATLYYIRISSFQHRITFSLREYLRLVSIFGNNISSNQYILSQYQHISLFHSFSLSHTHTFSFSKSYFEITKIDILQQNIYSWFPFQSTKNWFLCFIWCISKYQVIQVMNFLLHNENYNAHLLIRILEERKGKLI